MDGPDDQQKFGNNPFAGLNIEGLPPGPEHIPQPIERKKSRGRVDILRNKAGRGGKTVTVITNFVGIGLPEKRSSPSRCKKPAAPAAR